MRSISDSRLSTGLSLAGKMSNSHSLANRQSRFTVSTGVSSAAAVSSTLRPVKKRNSTDLCLARVNRLEPPQRIVQFDEVPLRLPRYLHRQLQRNSGRSSASLVVVPGASVINEGSARIVRAAIAKKSGAILHWMRLRSTSRRYASLTSALAAGCDLCAHEPGPSRPTDAAPDSPMAGAGRRLRVRHFPREAGRSACQRRRARAKFTPSCPPMPLFGSVFRLRK